MTPDDGRRTTPPEDPHHAPESRSPRHRQDRRSPPQRHDPRRLAPADLLVTARRPERAEELRARHGVTPVGNAEAAKTADTLILTVKPQDMGTLLDELAPHVPADRLVISGAVSITTASIEERLATGTPVVRVMTNTPALVDEAMSVISA